MTVFLRVLDADDKAAALLAAIREPDMARGKHRFELEPASFATVPRSPFAYWASSRIRGLFESGEPFEASGRAARVGVATLDNFRFLRLAWEVPTPHNHQDWCPYAKGGAYSPFYDAITLTIRWTSNGREVKRYVEQKVGSASRKVQATEFYFRPGITWPSRTQSGFAPRILPAGCIFDTKGNSAFIPRDDEDEILAFLSLFLSLPFRSLVNLQMSFGSYEVGVVQRTPIPLMSEARTALSELSRRGWSLKRSLDTQNETSPAFGLPALLQVSGESLAQRADAWARRVSAVEAELIAIQAEIDERCFNLYSIDESDRRTMAEGSTGSVGEAEVDSDAESDGDSEVVDSEDIAADAVSLAAELVSWAVGVAFGRFDVRFATGERSLTAEPRLFDPLPVCSPAMLTDTEGLPVASAPAGYPQDFPQNGILVDDPGHRRDLTAAIRSVFDTVFGGTADLWWNEVAALLESKEQDLRAWIASSFFEHHLKRYSKSRRKAPLLWQLATPSGRYSAWLYVHRLTRDSFFQLQNDVVAPKVAHEERRLTDLVQTAGGTPSARERQEIAAQTVFVEELRTLLDEVKRLAPLWNPMLDDGVLLTMAPLWRLVPQHKSWQRELKGKWDDLAGATYDWAQGAMHLWPERVVPKCATDRSLAIAHRLEDIFWTEVEGKWKPRPTPTRPLDDLVRERTSASMKAALKSVLEAPATSARGGRGRVRRTATAHSDKETL